MFVLMMQGETLSASFPDDSGLGERFWYWRGASGRRYIHSIYRRDLCPPVAGAVVVIVRLQGGSRRPVAVGRFTAEALAAIAMTSGGRPEEEEIHVHLLARDEEAAQRVLDDLQAAMTAGPPARAEARSIPKPVQLDLLAA